MKIFFKLSQISLFAGIFLSSCLGSKFLKEDEQLLAKQKINGLTSALEDDASGLYEQERNTRMLFGYPFTHLAHLYMLGENGFIFKGYDKQKAIAKRDSVESKYDRKIVTAKNEKKKQKLRNKKAKKYDKKNRKVQQGNQLMRWGEPLSTYDHKKTRLTSENIRLYLNSKGYFDAEITIDTSTYDSLNVIGKFGRDVRSWISGWAGHKDRYINLEYDVELNNRYFIDSVEYLIPDPALRDLVTENLKESPLKKGYYDQDILTQERDFIFDLAANNGYYEFSKQYVEFNVDTVNLGKDTLIVREVIGNPKGKDRHKIFYIDSIVFVTNTGLDQSVNRDFTKDGDIAFNFGGNNYSERILNWRIPLDQDDRYSRLMTIETQRQLAFLDIYKFININYDTTGNYFTTTIFTTPFDKYQTSSEFGLSSTVGTPGPFFNVNLKNRNTFRAMEITSFDASAKLEDLREVQGESSSSFNGTYTSRQFGAEVAITLPQFLFPLGDYYQNKIGQYNPKTRASFGFSFQDRIGEFTQLTYTGAWIYSWQVRDKIRFTLTPVQINLNNTETSERFRIFLDGLDEDGSTYPRAFESAVFSTTNFTMDMNIGRYGQGGQGSFIGIEAEIGGNPNRWFGRSIFAESLEKFQYVRTNVDLRKIDRLTRKLNLAYRFNIGFAYPYSNNDALPYIKNFFAGGSNSIRAWRPRRLGPGANADFDEIDGNPTDEIDYREERPGDLLIETSVELRQDLVGFVEGALFLDAGNIWLVRSRSVSPDDQGDDGVFRINSFMNEIAVGAGVGLRFDLQFLIFRLDLGMKLYDPGQLEGKRFVGDELFSDFNRNTEINIGIGYPF